MNILFPFTLRHTCSTSWKTTSTMQSKWPLLHADTTRHARMAAVYLMLHVLQNKQLEHTVKAAGCHT